MIRESELLEAIKECQSEKNPDSKTCIKLASYYTILNNMDTGHSYSSEQVRYRSGSEFSRVIEGIPFESVIEVMDELMDALKILSPKLYKATLNKFIM